MADPSTDTWHETMGLSTAKQLRSAELEIGGVREELTRQAATNEDLQATLAMRAGQLRSSREALSETQAALSASQADLTSMQRQRDEAREMHAEASNEARVMRETAERYLTHLDEVGKALAVANHQNRLMTAENEAALRRLNEAAEQAEKLRGYWQECSRHRDQILAELAGPRIWQAIEVGTCFRCGGPIVRGQQVEPQSGTTKGSFAHVACPAEES